MNVIAKPDRMVFRGAMRTRISLILALCFICATPVRAGQCPHRVVVAAILGLGVTLTSVLPTTYKRPVALGTAAVLGAYVSWWVYSILPAAQEQTPEADLE